MLILSSEDYLHELVRNEVLGLSQPNEVISSTVSSPNLTFTGQA